MTRFESHCSGSHQVLDMPLQCELIDCSHNGKEMACIWLPTAVTSNSWGRLKKTGSQGKMILFMGKLAYCLKYRLGHDWPWLHLVMLNITVDVHFSLKSKFELQWWLCSLGPFLLPSYCSAVYRVCPPLTWSGKLSAMFAMQPARGVRGMPSLLSKGMTWKLLFPFSVGENLAHGCTWL